jgi:hypothetical protein
VAFSPDGHRLATLAEFGEVWLWDARPLLELPGDEKAPPDADEIAYRRWATRRDRSWHDGEARRLQDEQPDAAVFHAAVAAGLPTGSIADLRHAVALFRSGHHADAAFALLRSLLWPPEEP